MLVPHDFIRELFVISSKMSKQLDIRTTSFDFRLGPGRSRADLVDFRQAGASFSCLRGYDHSELPFGMVFDSALEGIDMPPHANQ